jgi:hypothetical protein
MTVGWMRRRLEARAEVRVTCYCMASVWFNRRVTERNAPGRALWRTIAWLERERPGLAARLGNYVTIVARVKR